MLKFDFASEVALRRDVEKQIRAASVKALNRTAKGIRAESSKLVAKKNGLKVGLVKSRVFISNARSNRLSSVVFFGGEKTLVPLINLKPRGEPVMTLRGVKTAVSIVNPVTKERMIYPGAFFGNARRSNKLMIFRRWGRARLPLSVARFPMSVRSLFQDVEIEALIGRQGDNLAGYYNQFFSSLK